MNFYKHYIGDFQRDTGHLSLTERGAYLALIHHYYATEKPLPNSLDSLCRISGAVTKAEREAVKSVISFFELMDSGLVHSRIEAEIEKAGDISSKNREIAVRREAKRKADREVKKQSLDEHEKSTKRAQSVPPDEHEKSTNQTPDTRHQTKPPSDNKTHTENLEGVSELEIAGRVCVGLRNLGVIHTNPQHADLLQLIRDGTTEQELLSAGSMAAEKGKGFSYALGIAKSRREEKKQAGANHATSTPNRNTSRLQHAERIGNHLDKLIEKEFGQGVDVGTV